MASSATTPHSCATADAQPAPSRRALCAVCLRPARTCICAAVRPVHLERTQVLVLMHPEEAGHAKGTGRLLHLCLADSRLMVGDAFAQDALASALFGPWCSRDERTPPRTALLYPQTPERPADIVDVAAPAGGTAPDRLRLVVLDATWRKSRQMLSAHPALQALPRLPLTQVPTSRYAIRKAHAAHQLSTLEATACALSLIEPNGAPVKALRESMDTFVALQRPFWPHAASPRPTEP